ncbi:MAG: hypothetical protein PHF00_09625, partial [Elusimicrobia bacterium]|nr:hypothetical protein [Elusimicrobiota bacterium]
LPGKNAKILLSNASINKELYAAGYDIAIPWWSVRRQGFYIRNIGYLRAFSRLSRLIESEGLESLLSNETRQRIAAFAEKSTAWIARYGFKAGIFADDMAFFNRLFIVSAALKIPSFRRSEHPTPRRFHRPHPSLA